MIGLLKTFNTSYIYCSILPWSVTDANLHNTDVYSISIRVIRRRWLSEDSARWSCRTHEREHHTFTGICGTTICTALSSAPPPTTTTSSTRRECSFRSLPPVVVAAPPSHKHHPKEMSPALCPCFLVLKFRIPSYDDCSSWKGNFNTCLYYF